jgi:hypothetical protein
MAAETTRSVSLELPCPLDEELEHETDIHG